MVYMHMYGNRIPTRISVSNPSRKPSAVFTVAETITDWWFGTFFIFPYVGNNHPNWLNWLIFFRGVETTNQKWMVGATKWPWYNPRMTWEPSQSSGSGVEKMAYTPATFIDISMIHFLCRKSNGTVELLGGASHLSNWVIIPIYPPNYII